MDRRLDMYLRDVRFGSRREWGTYVRRATAQHQSMVAEVDEFIAQVAARLAVLNEFIGRHDGD